MMADPRIVKNPCVIRTITYRELRELSYMGATVLHEDAIFPVHYAGIPINIRNTNDPTADGTMIVANCTDFPESGTITGIAGKKGFSVITIEKDQMNSEIGFGRRILSVLEDMGVPFEHLPSGIDTMSVVVTTSHLEGKREQVVRAIYRAVSPDSVSVEDGIALIAVVGRAIGTSRDIAARTFTAISEADLNVRMIDLGSSGLNIIIGLHEEDYENGVRAIYGAFGA
jgi:aspartate kinase